MYERLTVDEFLALFGRTADFAKCVACVDSQEYLSLITYLVERSKPG